VTRFLGEVNEMSEEKIVSIIRDFVEAYEKRDVEKMLSFLTEDVVWVDHVGTFKGKEEAKHFLTWEAQTTPGLKIRDAGIGIMVKGNKAVYEHVFDSVSLDGGKCHGMSGIGVFEFKDEQIQQHRLLYDRLSVVKQTAKGWFAKKVVDAIVNRWEKGLH